MSSMHTPDSSTMTPEKADYMARCFVYGMRMHGHSGKMEPACGEFSERFLPHPWVREAITEGWGKELRSHLVLTVRKRIMLNQDWRNIDQLMPPQEWVQVAKADAARLAHARAWQRANLPEGVGLAALLAKIARQSGIVH